MGETLTDVSALPGLLVLPRWLTTLCRVTQWILTANLALGLGTLTILLYFAWHTRARLRKQLLSIRQQQRDGDRTLRQVTGLKKSMQASEKSQRELLRQNRAALRSISESRNELLLMQGLFSAITFRYPVFFGAWAIDGYLAREIVDTLERTRPRVVVELGSGASTVLIAAILDRLGLKNTRHIAVDHSDVFLETTRRNLALQDFSVTTELWHCPLVETAPGGPAWYSGIAQRLADAEVDLVLIDGPPGNLHPESRRPALDVLRPFLSAHAVVVLDDALRERERATLLAWSKAYPDLQVRLVKHGRGHAVLSFGSSSDSQYPTPV